MALEKVKEKMGIYHVNFPQEKVYVHHDKPHYVLGEQIWFKVYLVSAILHDPLTPSQQVTVELIDPGNVVLSTSTIRIEDGGGNGDFRLGADWETGKYLIRAYTNYQRNFEEPFFFEKEIRVYNAYTSIGEGSVSDQNDVLEEPGNDSSMSETDLNVLFFPEGGDLVAGITTKVAVNAINKQFEGEALQGSIVTSSGTIVSRFSTHKTGLGVFKLIPESGETYSANVSYQGEELSFKLPQVKDIGYSLSITENADTLTILASSNSPTGLAGTFVVGHIRGQLIGFVDGLSGPKSMF
ncbi:MAG: hypothetical protein HKN16_04585, partial [Saprospiraceae bacterium]|nr:hypothetical protein [Saprospiraceae bacterium]